MGCNFDQAERALLQAFVPFMVGIDVFFLLLGLCLCAFGAGALTWLPASRSTRLARHSIAVRLGGVAVCIMALGQFAMTAELNQSLAGGHPAPLGMALSIGGLLALLVVLSGARRAV